MKIENDYVALLAHDKILIKHPKTQKETTLYRIIAKKSFIVKNEFIERSIDAYKIGGYIEYIDTMDNENYSWIDNRCRVFGDLKISNTLFSENVIAFGTGIIEDCVIKNNSRIYLENGSIKKSKVNDLVEIKGNVTIDNCELYNSAMIFEHPTVIDSKLYDGSIIRGAAKVTNCELKDVSQIQGEAIVNNCKLSARSVILEGVRENEILAEDIVLNIFKGQDNS